MPWDVVMADPVAALADARAAFGDTFVVDSGPDRYLFTFDPAGVAAFYALPEQAASKGVADWKMLRRKVPDELFAGRRTLPHELFGRDDRASQLAAVRAALDATVDELGERGSVDLFALTRRLGHRVGFASWAGPVALTGAPFERLVAAFDALDGAAAFVHPEAMAAVEASGKAAERRALDEIAAVIGAQLDTPVDRAAHPIFCRIVDAWAGEPEPARSIGVGYDVALLHIASMSNLFAALGWTFVDLLAHPAERDRILAGDTLLAEQCALESTRLAQRSIMARLVLEPVHFEAGGISYEVAAGATIATLLPLTNTSAGPGLERWEPSRWQRGRLADAAELPAPELVTSFGHGRHTCPAQPFSLAAMTAIVARLFGAFELAAATPERPRQEPAQIGGVARASAPYLMTYRRRADPAG